MSTLLSILLASIFAIAVDFAYSLLSRLRLHRSFPNPLARLLEKLSSSRFFANRKRNNTEQTRRLTPPVAVRYKLPRL